MASESSHEGHATKRPQVSTAWQALVYFVDKFGPVTVGLAVSLWWGAENIVKPLIGRHLEFLDQEVELRSQDVQTRAKELEARETMTKTLESIENTNGRALAELQAQGRRLDVLIMQQQRPVRE